MGANAQSKAYLLNIHYIRGELKLNSVFVTVAQIQKSVGKNSNTYEAIIEDFNGKTLYTMFFYINRGFIGPPAIGGEQPNYIEQDDLNFALILPYFKNGSYIKIFSPKKKLLLKVDVSVFANTCGDGVCQRQENYKTCPQDCSSGGKDNYCDKVKDGICDPDCKMGEDPDCVGHLVKPTSNQSTPVATP